MARALGIAGAQKLIAQKALAHTQGRAKRLRIIAMDLHREAPRDGDNLNRWGERRSAEDGPPAMEFGTLFARIDQGLTLTDDGATVVVNTVHLEHGTIHMGARPLGRLAIAVLRQEVDSGG